MESAHSVSLDTELLERFQVLRPGLGCIVGDEDDFLAQFSEMLQSLFDTWNDVCSVIDDSIAVQEKSVDRVQEFLVLFGG